MTAYWIQWFRHALVAEKLASGFWEVAAPVGTSHHDRYSQLLKWIGPGEPPGADLYPDVIKEGAK